MLQKGQKVRVKTYQRTRTIYNGGEVSPGDITTYPGGWEGVVTGFYDGTPGPDFIEVNRDGSGPEGDYYEFTEDELEVIE